MSWIILAFRQGLANERALKILLQHGETYQALALANSVAHATGRNFGVEMSLNFPAGQSMPDDVGLLGTRNMSLIIDKGRKKFERVTVDVVQAHAAKIDEGVRFEPVSVGYEGFNATTDSGRVTVLPGAVYLWLPIDARVERFLDWLFTNAYGLVPPNE